MKITSAQINQGYYHQQQDKLDTNMQRTTVNTDDVVDGKFTLESYDTRTQTQSLHSRSVSKIADQTSGENQKLSANYSQTSQLNTQQTTQIEIDLWRSEGGNTAPENIEYVHTQTKKTYESTERLIFESVGQVTTEDGLKIDFMLHTDFNRQYYQEGESEVLERAREWVDPLVISLTGQIPSIADGTFQFDINADGKLDQMGKLASGTGYIAFDKNVDGIINDGHELFGGISGQGFDDLAQYDDDGNGWIDENDAIYSKLSVWQPINETEGQLISFSEAKVGAIFLQSEETSFTYRDGNNEAQARIRQSGVALMESGQATHVAQLDWAQPYNLGDNISWMDLANTGSLIAIQADILSQEQQPVRGNRPNQNPAQEANSLSVSSTQQNRAPAALVSTQTSFQQNQTVQTKMQFTSVTTSANLNTFNTLSRYESQESNTVEKEYKYTIFDRAEFEEEIETKDPKLEELRAVIQALKELRENNQKQQEALFNKFPLLNNEP